MTELLIGIALGIALGAIGFWLIKPATKIVVQAGEQDLRRVTLQLDRLNWKANATEERDRVVAIDLDAARVRAADALGEPGAAADAAVLPTTEEPT